MIGLGAATNGFSVGDLVLPMRRGTWTQFMLAGADHGGSIAAEDECISGRHAYDQSGVRLGHARQLRALQKGDWVIQNAANSAVGRCVIQIARSRGWKTLNVVRRSDVIEDLKALGADEVVLEGCDLREISRRTLWRAPAQTRAQRCGRRKRAHLANALSDCGVLVTYGAMARQTLKIPNGLLIFRNLEFKGSGRVGGFARVRPPERPKCGTRWRVFP